MMQFIALGMQIAGAAQRAVASYYEAKSEKSRLGFEADMAEINARMVDRQVERTMDAGRREVQRSRMQTAALKGRQIAAMGAGGIALDEGSALQLLASTDYIGEIDANTLEANAIAQAWGHRVEAVNLRSAARSGRSAAAAIKPDVAATSSIMGSAGSVASTWYSASKAGGSSAPASAPASGTSPNTSGLSSSGLSGGFWGS